ncbi:MAG: UDP-N-acetylmuramoyl-L-alanyl-D-glutamate--2,6-diaminopimelate ligase [Faecousia sp.]
MTLWDLLREVPVLETKADPNLQITSIACDSRKVCEGCLFVAISGFSADGNRFISDAVKKGAAAVVTAYRPRDDVPYILVENDRQALALLSCCFYHHPARDVTMIGITGTNGKTSVSWLLKQVLEKCAGAKVGLIGTVNNMIGEEVLSTERTTPESLELQRLLSRMRAPGCTHVVMEVSSHAIALHRVTGIRFDVAAFTNLSEDHLDFHSSMEEYCAVKARLFWQCEKAVLNRDDPWFAEMSKGISCPVLLTSVKEPGDLRAEEVTLRADGVSFTAVTTSERAAVTVPIPGSFTVYNALTVLGIAMQLGISLSVAAAAIASVKGVPGRVEVIPTPGKPYTVLRDYAHTPDGLEKVLLSLREFCLGKLILVFGCGGNRDRAKRPIMGRIGVQMADFAVITSDNPRWEDPVEIIREILSGVPENMGNFKVIENRPKAIRYALDIGKKHDIILLAGKGHETFQEIRGVKYPMDERKEVNAYLRETEE